MDGEAEIAYVADIGMTQFQERSGPFKDYQPSKPELVHTWYAYPMESMMATTVKGAEQLKCWNDFAGKPVYFTQAGFQNWLNWQRIFKALDYNFNTCRSTTRPTACPGARHHRRLGDLHHDRPSTSSLLEDQCAWTSG